ncbi:MAG: carbohydrate porin [Methyloligella sp. ZOD6]
MAASERGEYDIREVSALARAKRFAQAVLSALPLLAMVGAVPAVTAQTIQEEGARLPGVPEESIAMSLPPKLADPAGMRSALARRGVTFQANYIGEMIGNTSGGYRRDAFYDGRLELALEADLETMLGWEGLRFFANGYQIHGKSLSTETLGVLMPVSFIEAAPATRLYEMWFEQRLFDEKVSIRFGQLAADSEFMLSDGSGAFLNASWGWPSIAATNMPQGGPAYPLATPGVRMAYDPNEQLGFLVGVFNGEAAGRCPAERDPQSCNPHGLEFPMGDPPLLIAEGAYRYNQGEGQLPGTIKLGGYRNFGDFEHQRVDAQGVPIAVSGDSPGIIDGDYGLYAIVDQMLFRFAGEGDPKGLSMFARIIGAPADRNPVDLYWEAGLTLTGMLASRPHDVIGIGYARTHISDDAAKAAADAGETVIPSHESLLEVSYIAEIVPGLNLQPNFQYFWNPGGHVPDPGNSAKAVADAAVFGLRTTVNY